MKRLLLLTCVSLLGGCTSDDFESNDSGESGGEVDISFRDGPVFDDSNETIDMCCPHTSNGKSWDVRCGADVNNTCPSSSGFTTGWSLGGSTVDFWTLVSCYTCGSNSAACSSTRWINNGVFGYECGGTSIRKLYNSLVDDDCGLSGCSSSSLTCLNSLHEDDAQELLTWVDISDGSGYSPADSCNTWRFDSSVKSMCCTTPFLAPPPAGYQEARCIASDFTLSANDPTCTAGPWQSVYSANNYTNLAWCYPCPGYSSSHNEFGAWDLSEDDRVNNLNSEWNHSLVFVDISFEGAPETWATEYNCGGYLIKSDGTVLQNFCQ